MVIWALGTVWLVYMIQEKKHGNQIATPFESLHDALLSGFAN